MMNAAEALSIILKAVRPLGSVTVSLSRSLGHAIAEDIVASEDIPPFDNTAMDGYAVRSEDCRDVPSILHIVDEIAAGSVAKRLLGPGQAMSIMTGAKIPEGADAVVQIEWTEHADESRIRVLRSVSPGHNIRRAGGDVERGTCVLKQGQTIRPQEIGVLASLGKPFVAVYRPAVVSVLATGNEVVEFNRPVPEGQIRNSNAYLLQALIEQCNAESMNRGIARDDKEELTYKIREGLKTDVLITSGGVSVGKYDLVIDVMKELGVDIRFWKVNIKPGMPLLFGVYHTSYVFGLPGNPVSTMVTFLKFVKPALLKMMGHRTLESGFVVRATLRHEMRKTDGKRHFVRGILETQDGTMTVRSAGSQASNVLTTLSKANCLIILPEEKEHFGAGDEVEVELL